MEDSGLNGSSDGQEHAKEVELRPSVAEILTMEKLPNKPILLVDRVILFTILHRGVYEEVYRLFLSDGEKTIQGM